MGATLPDGERGGNDAAEAVHSSLDLGLGSRGIMQVGQAPASPLGICLSYQPHDHPPPTHRPRFEVGHHQVLANDDRPRIAPSHIGE